MRCWWSLKFYDSISAGKKFAVQKLNCVKVFFKFGNFFQKAFEENLKKVEKEAYEKREELGIEIDQLPSLVIDAIQVVDIFRQDPTRSGLEEKKMVISN